MKIDWITKKLAISPAIDNYEKLTEEGVTAVINVRGETHDDINELSKRGIAYFYIPIPDWLPPRRGQMLQFKELVDNNEMVLVHCEMGIGRSGALAISYLLESGRCSDLEESFRFMKRAGHPVDNMWISQKEKLRKHYG